VTKEKFGGKVDILVNNAGILKETQYEGKMFWCEPTECQQYGLNEAK